MNYFAIGEDKSFKNVLEVEEWEKLWENATPSADFPAQDISISLNEGDEIAIECNSYDGDDDLYTNLFFHKVRMEGGLILTWSQIEFKTSEKHFINATRKIYFDSNVIRIRIATAISTSSGTSWNWTSPNDILIPIAIYRRKTNKFN